MTSTVISTHISLTVTHLRLCFPNDTAAGLIEDCHVAVAGPRQDGSCVCETQNGETAISLSLPFEFVIFSKVTAHTY